MSRWGSRAGQQLQYSLGKEVLKHLCTVVLLFTTKGRAQYNFQGTVQQQGTTHPQAVRWNPEYLEQGRLMWQYCSTLFSRGSSDSQPGIFSCLPNCIPFITWPEVLLYSLTLTALSIISSEQGTPPHCVSSALPLRDPLTLLPTQGSPSTAAMNFAGQQWNSQTLHLPSLIDILCYGPNMGPHLQWHLTANL